MEVRTVRPRQVTGHCWWTWLLPAYDESPGMSTVVGNCEGVIG